MAGLAITRRNLPHWTLEGSWYYVTFCVKNGVLSPDERTLVLAHLKARHCDLYRLEAASVMPDHVHMILRPNAGQGLSRVMRMIKGGVSRMINLRRGTKGQLWQPESWDRILRSEQEFQQKLQYMLLNPVKAGLIEDPWAYPWWFLAPDSGD